MSKAKILIVEDERLAAEYLKFIIEDAGYSVIDICDRGADAIKVALQLKPDLIFMDIMLKDNISGSEAALKITSMIDTKIVFLTAYCDDEMIEYAIDSKAVSYIIKPYREDQIIATLKVALGKSLITKDSNIVNLKNGYWYDLESKKLYKENREILLKNSEQKLVDCLCKNAGTAIDYKQIITCIYDKEVNTSALRTLVSRINTTLGYKLIENISGTGYKI